MSSNFIYLLLHIIFNKPHNDTHHFIKEDSSKDWTSSLIPSPTPSGPLSTARRSPQALNQE